MSTLVIKLLITSAEKFAIENSKIDAYPQLNNTQICKYNVHVVTQTCMITCMHQYTCTKADIKNQPKIALFHMTTVMKNSHFLEPHRHPTDTTHTKLRPETPFIHLSGIHNINRHQSTCTSKWAYTIPPSGYASASCPKWVYTIPQVAMLLLPTPSGHTQHYPFCPK